MERQVMLDRSARLYRLDLEGSANVGEHGGAERQGLRVMLLPTLVFGAKIECSRMLQVRGQDNSFVASLSWQLNPEVPGIEGDEHEVEVLGGQILGSERVEAVDSISKGTSVPNMLPSQSRQARCIRI